MRRRRVGRPGLVGTAARTAVVAGTAKAVVGPGNVGRAMPPADAHATQAQPQFVQAPVTASSGFSDESIAKLKQLGDLRSAGVLTDEEFASAKAKLLP